MANTASKHSNTLYLKVKNSIKNDIRVGKLLHGTKLEPEIDLCEKYDVSRVTIRRALLELEKENYIKRLPNKGCIVSYNPIEHFILGLYSFSEEVRKRGRVPTSQFLGMEEIAVGQVSANMIHDLRHKLFLRDNDRVYHFRYLRFVDGERVALDNSFIPVKFCPSITVEDMQNADSAFEIMERFDCRPDRAQEYFWGYAVESEEEADALDVNLGFAALRVMRIGYSKGFPVFLNNRIFKGDNFYYRIDLQSYPETP